jgi:hypothetical protein
MNEDNPYAPPAAIADVLPGGPPSPDALDNPVHFAGEVTAAQFRMVQKLLLPWWARPPVMGVFIVVLLVTMGSGWKAALAAPLSLLPDLITGAFFVLALWAVNAFASRRNWTTYSKLHGRLRGTVGPGGIELSSDTTTSKFSWGKIVKHKRVPELTLVFYAPRCAFFFPSNFFSSAAEWERFNGIVAKYAPYE